MTSLPTPIIGLIVAVFVLVWLVLRTRVHALIAMLAAACIAGLLGGMGIDKTLSVITSGFGTTLGSIGLVIGLGVMMGRLLEVSGAAERIAWSFIKWLGKRREEWALAITGYIVSIPIFVDSAFVILYPVAKALAKSGKRSLLTLGVALAGGLAVPCVIGIVFYAQWLDKRYPDFVPRTLNADEVNAALEQYNKEKEQKDLPSLTLSLLPIVVPIVLIFLKAICSTLATVEGWSGLATHPVVQAINFVGSPVIALAISVLLAVYTLVPRMDKHTTAERLEEGLQSAGIILLVTGAGGALGAILRDSGAGQQLAEQVANLPISPILIPFIVATLVRLIQGSGTVAMITAASISAPILAQIPGINMLLAAQAATMGSLFFGYFNDSLFWVVNRMMGVSDVKQQMVVWSVPTTIAWAIGGTGVALINLLFGSGGSWLDPLLPIVVLAAIMLWVRWQAQGIKDKLVVKD
ncbi:TPA: GntP family permease [Salmonella enterica]|uniref:GntP family permease n=1 Tax=Salmonella enterica I TaxID=59201 RepID=A0A612GK08_SALET|nr:GntP family permease [Salmonella enterica subsp. enterica]HED0164817.1 GntP family permease [Salmonella enterica subsp. enterica serovar Mississippi]ECW0082477.1 GntP family permease [Salmonella enterica subsp. enterica]ECW0830557.1 GntP family permease [Salmonella enterica subsp. enterica]ECW0855103.1 GntP family permease [Salmonella enterica subsp. enterica]